MKKSTSIIAAASICILNSCQNSHKQELKSVKPNILFILADDLGYHDLSVMGSNYYETPNINGIANEGMIFTDGYANSQIVWMD